MDRLEHACLSADCIFSVAGARLEDSGEFTTGLGGVRDATRWGVPLLP